MKKSPPKMLSSLFDPRFPYAGDREAFEAKKWISIGPVPPKQLENFFGVKCVVCSSPVLYLASNASFRIDGVYPRVTEYTKRQDPQTYAIAVEQDAKAATIAGGLLRLVRKAVLASGGCEDSLRLEDDSFYTRVFACDDHARALDFAAFSWGMRSGEHSDLIVDHLTAPLFFKNLTRENMDRIYQIQSAYEAEVKLK